MSKMNNRDSKHLLDYLKSQRLMTLATCSKTPWVASVYFVTDKDLNLYFVSSPDSRHCKEIEKNEKVACAIADSHILNSQKKYGMQIEGVATQVKGWKKTEVMLKMWHKINPGAEKINIANMQSGAVSSRVYKVKPTLIKHMDKDLYGKDTYGIYKLK
ncbi:pyridoxamine 5'-phosphate oxidase family protein [Patescibacteria group bacterium]